MIFLMVCLASSRSLPTPYRTTSRWLHSWLALSSCGKDEQTKCKWEVIPKRTLTDVRPYSTAGVGANTIHFQGGFIIKSTLRSCSNTEPPHLWNGKVSGVLNVPWLFVQLRKSWVQAFVFTARLVVLVQSWFLWRRTALRLAVHGRGKHLHGTKVTKKKKKKRK